MILHEEVAIKLGELDELLTWENHRSEARICRVPYLLKEVKEISFTPQTVGLGPFHHGNGKLPNQRLIKMESVRRNLNRIFASSNSPAASSSTSTSHEKLQFLQQQFETKASEIKSCYQEDFSFVGDMFILDCCFVIEMCVLLAGKADPILGQIRRGGSLTASILRDVLMMENQLPFFLLEMLFGLQNLPLSYRLQIPCWGYEKVFRLPTLAIKKWRWNTGKQILQRPPAHLLDCLQSLMASYLSRELHEEDIVAKKTCLTKTCSSTLRKTKICLSKTCSSALGKATESKLKSLPRAEDLRKSGIVIKAGDKFSFEEKYLHFRGILHLPILTLQDSTEVVLRNIQAYEDCFCSGNKMVSYFFFMMNWMIDKESDVALLRKVEVIDSYLESDQAVANLVNNLGINVCWDQIPEIEERIWKKVQIYHTSSWRGMAKEFVDTHFSKPWHVCATLAAVFLLILTLIQTLYSVLSYY